MRKSMVSILLLQLITFFILLPNQVNAASDGVTNMSKAKIHIDQALDLAKQNLSLSKQSYNQFRDQWMDVEDTVKDDSRSAYKDIEAQMGQVEYAYMVNKQDEVTSALRNFQSVLNRYIQGQYRNEAPLKEDNVTLPDFIILLQKTKDSVSNRNQVQALKDISAVREKWLSVEGNVVAQSASVYSDSERDMVVVNAMISKENYDNAAKLLDNMIAYLSPLAQKTSYTFWDAAMIPIREGLEALLVVGALLAFVKKSKDGKGRQWVWSGVLIGLLLSAVLAVIVKFVLSSGAFGTNNFLIGGWTGIFAAAMLLYMSYWLHSNSNIQQWNRYIQTKTQTALSTGRVVSLGVLSFLAVFREGTETVLFIIGMVNQISLQQLLLGILLGFGILAVIAFLMLFVGVRLPVRPFFLLSSLIVFYLCIKFTGLGIHSLQLAGVVPVSNASVLPSIDFLGFFPSWQSAVPQFIVVLGAVLVLVWNTYREKQTKQATIVS